MGKNKKKTTSGRNCYLVLGVKADTTQQTLKQAYMALSKKYHPDKHDQQDQESIDKATAKFQEIKKAYDEALAGLDEEVFDDDDYEQQPPQQKHYKRGQQHQQSYFSYDFSESKDTEEEYDDYDYDQHMYKRGQQESYFSFDVSSSKEITIKETKVEQEVVLHEDQISEDEEIERRAAEKVEEFFAMEQRGIEKLKTKRHAVVKEEDQKGNEKMKTKREVLVKDEQVLGIGVDLGAGLKQFRTKKNYGKSEHELITGCRSCNKWFEGVQQYLSHIHSDKHRKKSSMSRFSSRCNGLWKVTYDTLSLRQRQDPSRWRELSQQVQQQIKATVTKVRASYTTCITENTNTGDTDTVCEYIKNISSDIDPNLIIECSATIQFCNAKFNSVADYHKYHRRQVYVEDIDPDQDTC